MLSTAAKQVRSCSRAGFPLPGVSVFRWLRSYFTLRRGAESQSLPTPVCKRDRRLHPSTDQISFPFPLLWGENRVILSSLSVSAMRAWPCSRAGRTGRPSASAGAASPASAEQSRLPPLRIWPNTSPVRSGKSEVLKSRLSRLRSETASCH